MMRGRWIVLSCCTLFCLASCATIRPDNARSIDAQVRVSAPAYPDHWYRVAINGQPCGYARYRVTAGSDTITTVYDEHIIESHGGEPLEMTYRSTWVETDDHRPIRYTVEQRDGAEAVEQTYSFAAAGIERVTRQGERQTRTTLKHPTGDWLTPARFDAELFEAMLLGEVRIVKRLWDPQVSREPFEVVYHDPRPGQAIELADGTVIRATRWQVDYGYLPGMPTFEYYDQAFAPVLYEMDMGGGAVVTRRQADASVADAAFDPPEMADRSVIAPDRPIDDIGRVKRAAYELTIGETGKWTTLPPQTAHQRVEQVDERTVRLTIDLTGGQGAQHVDEPPGEAYLASTIAVDHRDAVIRALADKILGRAGPVDDVPAYARACEQYIATHLRGGGLSVGSATASEVARNWRGDCTEAAVLLAAVLRAKGIPSRCVYGLVYTDQPFLNHAGVFVFHMWTQYWAAGRADEPGQWRDVDAAMLGYSAGHLALGVSAMGEDAEQEQMRLVPMTADLSIRVVETGR